MNVFLHSPGISCFCFRVFRKLDDGALPLVCKLVKQSTCFTTFTGSFSLGPLPGGALSQTVPVVVRPVRSMPLFCKTGGGQLWSGSGQASECSLTAGFRRGILTEAKNQELNSHNSAGTQHSPWEVFMHWTVTQFEDYYTRLSWSWDFTDFFKMKLTIWTQIFNLSLTDSQL